MELNINLERVVRFYHVAEGRSFIKAAKKMNVDQTWLSRQIQQLEAQVGCRLLERSTRYVTLTPEGLEFFEAAHELAEAAKRVRTLASSLGTPKRRELVLGISSSTFWVPARQRLVETPAPAILKFPLEQWYATAPNSFKTYASTTLTCVLSGSASTWNNSTT